VKIRWDCAARAARRVDRKRDRAMLRIAKARSSERATLASVKPGFAAGSKCRSTPLSRTTGTMGMSLRNRAGTKRRKAAGKRSNAEGSAHWLALSVWIDRAASYTC
jgi:hypothetical protein